MRLTIFGNARHCRWICFATLIASLSASKATLGQDQLEQYRIFAAEKVVPTRAHPDHAGVIDEQLFTVFGTYTVPGLSASSVVSSDGSPRQIFVRGYQRTQPELRETTRHATRFLSGKKDAVLPPRAGIPGPTFEFRPGDFLKIRLHNYLNVSDNPWLNEYQNNVPLSGPNGKAATDQLSIQATHEVNIPHGFNETNLHVHGLHVDPKQDNVTVLILPQDGDPSMLSPNQQTLVQNINHWWQRQYQ